VENIMGDGKDSRRNQEAATVKQEVHSRALWLRFYARNAAARQLAEKVLFQGRSYVKHVEGRDLRRGEVFEGVKPYEHYALRVIVLYRPDMPLQFWKAAYFDPETWTVYYHFRGNCGPYLVEE